MKSVNVREMMESFNLSVSQVFEKIYDIKPEIIYFPAGEYSVDRTLTVPAETSAVYGDGMGATLINASSDFTDTVILYAHRGNIVDLAAQFSVGPKRYDTSLHLTNFDDISQRITADDLLIIEDYTNNSYSDMNIAGQPRNYHAGEVVKIAKINLLDKTIHLLDGIQASYSKASLRLGRMPKSLPLRIRDLSITGTSRISGKECGLNIENGRNVIIERIKLTGSITCLCEIAHCIDSSIDSIVADQTSLESVNLGQQYGLSISNCQNINITNSCLIGIRHGLTLGGSSGAPWDLVNRQIKVSSCRLSSVIGGAMPALDAHGNAEYYSFQDNNIFGAVSIAGQYGRIRGNQIFSQGPGILCVEVKSLEHEIKDNLIHCVSELGETDVIKVEGKPDIEIPHHYGAVRIMIYDYVNQSAGALLLSDNRIVIDRSDGTVMTAYNQAERIEATAEIIFLNNYVHCDTPKDKPIRPFFRVRGKGKITTDGRIFGIKRLIAKRNILRNCSDTNPLRVDEYLKNEND